MSKHVCEGVPLVYGPNYLEIEVLRPGREQTKWDPLISELKTADFCPHIYRADWDDEESDFMDHTENIIDMTMELTKPGQRAAVGGSSILGLMAAHSVSYMELLQPEERRDLRYFGFSISPYFQPLVQLALTNPESDLNAPVPDWLIPQLGRDRFFSKTLRDEVAAIPLPFVISPSQLYVGDEEDSNVRAAHDFLYALWPKATSLRINGMVHDTLSSNYLEVIGRNIGALSLAPRSELSLDDKVDALRTELGRRALVELGGQSCSDTTPFLDFVESAVAAS